MARQIKSGDAMLTCAHCGEQCGDYDGGYAGIMTTDGGIPLCHPNAAGRPDCYRRVTVYGEMLGALRDVKPKPAGISAIRGAA